MITVYGILTQSQISDFLLYMCSDVSVHVGDGVVAQEGREKMDVASVRLWYVCKGKDEGQQEDKEAVLPVNYIVCVCVCVCGGGAVKE